MRKILVTGGQGFIGHHLTYALRDKFRDSDTEVYTVGRNSIAGEKTQVVGEGAGFQPTNKHYVADLTKDRAVQGVMEHLQPDVIYHLAANPNGKPDNEHPMDIIDDNVKMTQGLVHYSPEGCRLINCSSITVYGDEKGKEEITYLEPTSVYAATKIGSEALVRAYHNTGQIVAVNLRLCATVGAGLTHGILYDFINKLETNPSFLQCLGEYPGSAKVFLHVDDAVDAFLLALEDWDGEDVNICGTGVVNVQEIAEIVAEEMELQPTIAFLGEGANWKGDNRKLEASNEKAFYLGWQPKYKKSKDAIVAAVKEELRTRRSL